MIAAAGGLLALFAVAAHFMSPIARKLAGGRDVELVLLNKSRPMLFVYHPVSRTINSVRLPGGTAGARGGGSARQRSCEVLRLFSKNEMNDQAAPGYIEVAAPDMDAFEELLNNWRSRPARFLPVFLYLLDLKKREATNLSPHEMLLAVLELSGLNSSDFIKEDFDKSRASGRLQPGTAAEEPGAGPVIVRLEVLNASGRKDLAVRVTKYLRKQGFDVLTFGTYGSVEKNTKIVNCSDNIGAARKAREALGLDRLEIYSKFSGLGISDAKIILGEDFDESNLKR